jgi:hypothetical protein
MCFLKKIQYDGHFSAGYKYMAKKIELIGIDIKGLDQDADPSRLKLKTKFIN